MEGEGREVKGSKQEGNTKEKLLSDAVSPGNANGQVQREKKR